MPIFFYSFWQQPDDVNDVIQNFNHRWDAAAYQGREKQTDDITLHIYAIIIYIFLQYELRPTTLLFSTLR